jgi:hypothetical protein
VSLQQANNGRNGEAHTPTRTTAQEPPEDRGRLLFTEDVRRDLLSGRKSASWVRHHFAPTHKRKLGRDNFWYERDARAWLDSLGEAE